MVVSFRAAREKSDLTVFGSTRSDWATLLGLCRLIGAVDGYGARDQRLNLHDLDSFGCIRRCDADGTTDQRGRIRTRAYSTTVGQRSHDASPHLLVAGVGKHEAATLGYLRVRWERCRSREKQSWWLLVPTVTCTAWLCFHVWITEPKHCDLCLCDPKTGFPLSQRQKMLFRRLSGLQIDDVEFHDSGPRRMTSPGRGHSSQQST